MNIASKMRAQIAGLSGKPTYPTPSLSPIIAFLEYLFCVFNKQFFDSALSKPVITLLEVGRRKVYGWFTVDKVWKDGTSDKHYELNICPEYLNRSIEDICATLIHEMVHLYNALNGIQDCSRSSQYHNKKFKDAAERYGLKVEKSEKYGYSSTSLKSETLEFIRSLDLTNFDLFRCGVENTTASDDDEAEAEIKKQLKPSSTRNYQCPKCKLKIRATREVRVRCEICDLRFEYTFKPRYKNDRKKISGVK